MDKQKKILLVSNMYPSKKYPHYGVFVKNIELNLLNSNFKIKKCILAKEDNKFLKIIKYFIFYIKIIFKGLFTDYDLIYAHYASHVSLPILIVKKIKKDVYIVINVHGNDIVPETKNDEKYIPNVKKLLDISNKIIVPSSYFQTILEKKYQIEVSKIFISSSGGVNHSIFYKYDRRTVCNNLNLDPKKKYIGYISRIEINKGWDTFIDACTKILMHYDVEIIVVGSGDESDLLENKIAEANINQHIHRMGLLSQQEIAKIFSILDIFCFPTRRKSESLGLVGIEAMACKTIVIGSSSYGPACYLENEKNGFTFDMYSSDDLANKMKKVLEMTDEEKELVISNAYNTSLLYDSNKVNKQLVEFFKKIL